MGKSKFTRCAAASAKAVVLLFILWALGHISLQHRAEERNKPDDPDEIEFDYSPVCVDKKVCDV